MVDRGYEEDQLSFRVIVPMTPDQTNQNEWLCVGLDADIESLRRIDASSLEAAFQPDRGRQPILRVKVNAMPILFALADAVALKLPILLTPGAACCIR